MFTLQPTPTAIGTVVPPWSTGALMERLPSLEDMAHKGMPSYVCNISHLYYLLPTLLQQLKEIYLTGSKQCPSIRFCMILHNLIKTFATMFVYIYVC